MLLNFCMSMSLSFVEGVGEAQNIGLKAPTAKKEDIDMNELLVAHMWAVVDFLQEKIQKDIRYYDAVGLMHGKIHDTYMEKQGLSKEEADEVIEGLATRYEEYREIFRNQSKPDHSKVAPFIASNISKNPNAMTDLFLHVHITLHLQNFIIQLAKLIDKFEIVN